MDKTFWVKDKDIQFAFKEKNGGTQNIPDSEYLKIKE